MIIDETNLDKTKVICLFVGTAHDFSDHVLRIASEEFPCCDFQRISHINDLGFFDRNGRHNLRAIIVHQSQSAELLTQLSKISDGFHGAMLALGYRDVPAARQVADAAETEAGGAQLGYLPMNLEIDRWVSVLRLLLCGESYMPRELIEHAAAVQEPAKQTVPDKLFDRLTEREFEVLSCAAQGNQNKIIADKLGLSVHTVKLHMHHVIAKLGVHNRTEATICYLEQQQSARVQ